MPIDHTPTVWLGVIICILVAVNAWLIVACERLDQRHQDALTNLDDEKRAHRITNALRWHAEDEIASLLGTNNTHQTIDQIKAGA